MTLDIIIPAWNAEETIQRLLLSIEEQVDKIEDVTVWVVDDASTDSTYHIVDTYSSKHYELCLIQLKNNVGRAGAINTAVEQSKGEALLFIDADCYFEQPRSLVKLIDEYKQQKRVCFGRMEDNANGFWSEYFNRAQKRKSLQNIHAFSTTFMLCSRKTYNTAGGFYEEYTHYGMEDRDLILRILSCTNSKDEISYVENAVVNHEGNDTLVLYCKKQFTSGRYSSSIFANRFPEQYQQMAYSKFDEKYCSNFRRLTLNILSPFRTLLITVFAKTIHIPIIPIDLRIIMAQSLAAISYYNGTKMND